MRLSQNSLSLPKLLIGVQLCTHIGGYAGSSTRTELAAGILALCVHGPVHLGSDSKAFLTKAQDVLDKSLADDDVCDSWHTSSDGDLWHHFEQAVLAKGPSSIKLTWVKGHATEDHISSGVTSSAHQQGNDRADALADQGVQLHGEDIYTLARLYTKRHSQYTGFFMNVANI